MIKARAVFRRRWSVLLAGLVLGMLAGSLSSLMAPESKDEVSYRVSQLIVANRLAQQQGNVEQDALRVTRGTVAENAAKALDESNSSTLSAKVSAVANTESSSIEVASSDKDPKVATKRVEAYVNAFLGVVNADLVSDQERRFTDLQQRVDQAETDLNAFNALNPMLGLVPSFDPQVDQALQSQQSELRQAVQSAKDQLQSEQLNAKATLPYSTLGPDAPKAVDSNLLPVPTGLPFRAALLGLFGLALAVGLVMIVERLIPRIDTRDELVAAVELPVIAEVGYFPHRNLPKADNGTLRIEGGWAEPYRRIRSAIQFLQAEEQPTANDGSAKPPPRVFMITSPSPSEGKSTTTAVTALAMAEAGERTLVIGGDFRRPSIPKLLGAPMAPGIREHARLDVARPSLDQIVHPTSHENLFIAPSGAPGKEVVGLADAAKALISEAVSEGATVLVDTSPVEVANDAIDLLPVVDHVILVVRSGRTLRKAMLHTIEQLQQHGAQIMGTALIGTPGLAKQQYYYEGYYSDEPPASTDGTLFPEPETPSGPSAAAKLKKSVRRSPSADPTPAPPSEPPSGLSTVRAEPLSSPAAPPAATDPPTASDPEEVSVARRVIRARSRAR